MSRKKTKFRKKAAIPSPGVGAGNAPGSIAVRFQPGNKMAVGHGPHRKPFKAAFDAVFTQKDLEDIARVAKAKAKKGDRHFIFEVRDTFDGRPAQTLQGPEGKDLIPPSLNIEFPKE